jgi:hypothetical protein
MMNELACMDRHVGAGMHACRLLLLLLLLRACWMNQHA